MSDADLDPIIEETARKHGFDAHEIPHEVMEAGIRFMHEAAPLLKRLDTANARWIMIIAEAVVEWVRRENSASPVIINRDNSAQDDSANRAIIEVESATAIDEHVAPVGAATEPSCLSP